jgi:hypothetical protein
MLIEIGNFLSCSFSSSFVLAAPDGLRLVRRRLLPYSTRVLLHFVTGSSQKHCERFSDEALEKYVHEDKEKVDTIIQES